MPRGRAHEQGALTQTGNTLDLALTGRGYFQVTGPDGETLYTRAAAFNKNATGQIVTAEGYLVQPTIVVPAEVETLAVNNSGQVFGTVRGETEPRLLGQLTVASFVNEVGLDPLGDNLYRETAASGFAFATPVVLTPTFVLMEDGAEAGRIEGYPGEDFFWGLLGQMIGMVQGDGPVPSE